MDQKTYDSLLLDFSGSICYVCDAKTHEILYMSRGGMELLGLERPEEYLGRTCFELIQGHDEVCSFCNMDQLRLGETQNWEYQNEKLDKYFWVIDRLVELDGRLCRMEIARDITKRQERVRRIEGDLSVKEALVECAAILALEGDFYTAVRRFLGTIGQFYRGGRAYLFEFDREAGTMRNTFEWCAQGVVAEMGSLQDVPLKTCDLWLERFEAEGAFVITDLDRELPHDSEIYLHLEGRGIQSLLAAPLRRNGDIIGFLGVDDPEKNLDDLTLLRLATGFVLAEVERRRFVQKLEYLSYTDTMTGLKNRNAYNNTLRRYRGAPPKALGVLFVDINGTKGINERLGHERGDYIIRRTATILRERMGEYTFRIAGDEFVALCANVDKDAFQSAVAELRRACGEDPDLTVSMGAIWKQGDLDVDDLLSQASDQMYGEKQRWYRAAIQRNVPIRGGLTGEVLRELQEDRFEVVYQPQFELKTGAVAGAEALVRKRGEDGQLVPPSLFIPVYERAKVIRHVDLFVLSEVCRAIRAWPDRSLPMRVSVNFSRVTLMEPNIVAEILAICAHHGVSTSNITIEVTESVGLMDFERLRELTDQLTQAGFALSLDDFGSRYSNFSILTAVNFDEVKFDKSLVDGLPQDPRSEAILRHSLALCRELKIPNIVAEGIETQSQAEALAGYGCDYGQGYYFSKPLPLEELSELLRKSRNEA